MFDTNKIRKSVAVLGWPKTMFSACLALLFTRIISFDQCLILVFLAWMLEAAPSGPIAKLTEGSAWPTKDNNVAVSLGRKRRRRLVATLPRPPQS
jgi:hypothetical protein